MGSPERFLCKKLPLIVPETPSQSCRLPAASMLPGSDCPATGFRSGGSGCSCRRVARLLADPKRHRRARGSENQIHLFESPLKILQNERSHLLRLEIIGIV